jgi:hypothetical protein
LSTTSNPGLRGGRPAANRLSHGTAHRDGLVIECLRARQLGGTGISFPFPILYK